MVEILLDIVSWACFIIGGFLCITSGVSLFRFPDVYTRLHGSGCIDSLGSGLILLGLTLQASHWIDIGKLMLIYGLILLTSPIAAHTISRTARAQGIPTNTPSPIED